MSLGKKNEMFLSSTSSSSNGKKGDDGDVVVVVEQKQKKKTGFFTAPHTLSRFEEVYLIGVRAKSLEAGAQTVLNFSQLQGKNFVHSTEIAEMELNWGVLPLALLRPLADGSCETLDPNLMRRDLCSGRFCN